MFPRDSGIEGKKKGREGSSRLRWEVWEGTYGSESYPRIQPRREGKELARWGKTRAAEVIRQECKRRVSDE